jgi:hypothetical protein
MVPTTRRRVIIACGNTIVYCMYLVVDGTAIGKVILGTKCNIKAEIQLFSQIKLISKRQACPCLLRS